MLWQPIGVIFHLQSHRAIEPNHLSGRPGQNAQHRQVGAFVGLLVGVVRHEDSLATRTQRAYAEESVRIVLPVRKYQRLFARYLIAAVQMAPAYLARSGGCDQRQASGSFEFNTCRVPSAPST